jgi:RHS repeat-associated protein
MQSRDVVQQIRRFAGTCCTRAMTALILGLAAMLGFPTGAAWAQSCSLGAQQPTEVVTLAASLKNDPDLILEYVHNTIEYEPLYGSNKGALGTLMDGRGSDFDQAQLFVGLLNAAASNLGTACYTTNFMSGYITVNSTTANAASWLGVQNNALGIGNLFAAGGIPIDASHFFGNGDGTLMSVDVAHIWVQVTLPSGGTYVFDPSFKQHVVSSGIGIAALKTAMGYTASHLLSDAGGPQSLYIYSGVNRTAIRNDLSGYAANLIAYLRNQAAAGTPLSLATLIGGKTIVPLTGSPIRQTSLPYQSTYNPTVTSYPTTNAYWNSYRTTLSIQMPGASASQAVQGYTDQYYGHRITICSVPASGQTSPPSCAPTTASGNYTPTLLIDGQVPSCTPTCMYQGTPQAVGTTWQVIFTPHHPFASSSLAYVNAPASRSLNVGGSYVVSNGWGQVGRGMVERHRHLLAQYLAAGMSPTSEAVMGETLMVNSAAWLAENAAQMQMADQLSIVTPITTLYYHGVGIAGQAVSLTPGDTAQSPYVDLPSNPINSMPQNLNSSTEGCTSSLWAPFLTHMGMSSILESGILEQMEASVPHFTAASTMKLLDQNIAASNGTTYFVDGTTAAGVSAYSTIRAALIQGGWSNTTLTNSVDGLVSAGDQLLLPGNGALQVGTHWTGSAYEYQTLTSGCPTAVGEIISGGLSGGFGGVTVPTGTAPSSPPATSGGSASASAGAQPQTLPGNAVTASAPAGNDSSASTGVAIEPTAPPVQTGQTATQAPGQTTGADPVDIASGSYVYDHIDLTNGSAGGLPLSLPFGRHYDSGAALSDVGMGLGFTHTYSLSAQVSSDPYEGMGADSAISGAAAIVANLVSQDILQTTPAIQNLTVRAVTARWWMDQLTNNVVVLSRPEGSETFVQLPDCTFDSPVGSTATLTQTLNTAGTCAAGNFNADTYTYTTARGVKLVFSGRVASATQSSAVAPANLASETWPGGVSISLTYDGNGNLNQVANSLGRTLTLTTASDGHHIGSVTNGVGTVSYGYTSGTNGVMHLTSATDPLSKSTQFLYSGASDPGTTLSIPVVGQTSQFTTFTAPSRLTGIIYPSTPGGVAFVSNHYDLIGHVAWQADADGNVTNAYIAGSRTEFVSNYQNTGRRVTYQTPRGRIVKNVLVQSPSFTTDVFSDTATSDGQDGVTSTQYDVLDRITQIMAPEGNNSILAYASAGAPCLASGTFSYPRNAFNVCSETQNPTSGSIDQHPSANGGLLLARTRTMLYEPVYNNVVSSSDFLSNTTTFSYDANGYPAGMVQPAVLDGTTNTNVQPSYSYGYSAQGLIQYALDPYGVNTTYAYNATGDLTQTVVDSASLQLTTTFGYDAIGNRISLRNANGFLANYCFDAKRQRTVVIPPLSSATANDNSTPACNGSGPPTASGALYTQISYDQDGRTLGTQRATGTGTFATTSTVYTPTGKVQTQRDTSGDTTTYTYDGADRVASATDGAGRQTAYTDDATGQVLTITKAGTLVESHAYYATGAISSRTYYNAAGTGVMSYIFDGFQRPGQIQWPDGSTNTFAYTPNDKEDYKATRAGQSITWTYDALNRPVTKNGYQPITYTYDQHGWLHSAAQIWQGLSSGPASGTWTRSYDRAGRLTGESRTADGRSLTYTRDNLGNTTYENTPTGNSFRFSYDGLNRMIDGLWIATQPQFAVDNLWGYTFDALDRPQSFGYNEPGGFGDTYTYTNANHCANGNGGGNGFDLQELYLSMGTSENPSTGLNQYYCYNNAHQVISTVTGYGGNAQDNAGAHPAAAGTYGYSVNTDNQTTAITGSLGISYSYDGNGNSLQSSDRFGASNTYRLLYDYEGRVVQVYGGGARGVGGSQWNYSYDPFGRRYSKSYQASVRPVSNTIYLPDEHNNEVGEYDGASGLVLRENAIDPLRVAPVAVLNYTNGANPVVTFNHLDRTGSVVATSSNGVLTNQYQYGPYGETAALVGSAFGYAGYRYDSESGLYYVRNRYYDPVPGRFVSPDPLGQGPGLNVYAYVGNDPLNNVDPQGLWGFGLQASASVEGGAIVAGAGATGSVGGGIFGGGSQGLNVGGYASGGAFAGGPGYGASYPAVQPGGTTAVAGAAAGGGGGIFFTNATSAAELGGPFNTYSLNTPIGSIQFGKSGSTWIFSATCGVPPCGIGTPTGAVSTYPTNTAATPSK